MCWRAELVHNEETNVASLQIQLISMYCRAIPLKISSRRISPNLNIN